jgi:hypothetical protein
MIAASPVRLVAKDSALRRRLPTRLTAEKERRHAQVFDVRSRGPAGQAVLPVVRRHAPSGSIFDAEFNIAAGRWQW